MTPAKLPVPEVAAQLPVATARIIGAALPHQTSGSSSTQPLLPAAIALLLLAVASGSLLRLQTRGRPRWH